MDVWIVVDPEHPETPIGGAWTTQELAFAHCHDSYVVIKITLDVDYTVGPA